MWARIETIRTAMARVTRLFWALLRVIVMMLAAGAGVSIFVMVAVTSVDVVMRAFGASLHGSYDIVRMAGAITIACALPYTTAVKGHVAIEYFFHKLNAAGRLIIDTLCRLLTIGMFGMLAWQSVLFGHSLRRTGSVSLTLQIPLYWVAYVIAASCLVTMFVTLYNLLHPGREMIKP